MKYILTPQAYDAGPNLPEEIKAEYGSSAQIVDWQVLKSALADPAALEEFIAEVGIPSQVATGPCDNIFVSNGGSMRLAGAITLFARHDGLRAPKFWVFDTIGNHMLDLGRWTHRSQALVAVPEDEERSNQSVFDRIHVSNGMFGGLMGLLIATCALMGGNPRHGRLA